MFLPMFLLKLLKTTESSIPCKRSPKSSNTAIQKRKGKQRSRRKETQSDNLDFHRLPIKSDIVVSLDSR